MAHHIIMPQGGQDIDKGTVVRWLKQENAPVRKGEVICEVETEKAVFEVQAPVDGYLIKILVPEGGEAVILAPIGIIGDLNEMIDSSQPASLPKDEDSLSFAFGKLEEDKEDTPLSIKKNKTRISPKAKRIAQDKGVDYQFIKGSGPQGRIVEKDILAYTQPPTTPPVVAPAMLTRREKQIITMTKVRKVIARKMQHSKQVIPHFYVTVAVDMTDALTFRTELNKIFSNPQEQEISVTDLIVRACAIALQEHPQLNCSLVDENQIALWDEINIGLAVNTDNGLLVPVLESAETLSLEQIARHTKKMIAAARDGKQYSLAEGRFTISNLGMYDVENFIAIINPPEAAILAVAGIEKKVVPLDNLTIGVRDCMKMTLSIDHRLGDGVMAAKFLNKMKSLLEAPKSLV